MYTSILAIIILNKIGLVFLFFKNKSKIKNESVQFEEFKNSIICKFVFDGSNKKIGESIAFKDDVLIIKSGKKYLGIPIKHIEIQEKTLLVKGLIEKDKAEKMGEKWRQESFKDLDYLEKENE